MIVVLVSAIRLPSRFVAEKKWAKKKNVKRKLCKLLGFQFCLCWMCGCYYYRSCVQNCYYKAFDSRQHSIVTISHCGKNTNRIFFLLRVELSRWHSGSILIGSGVSCNNLLIFHKIHSLNCWIECLSTKLMLVALAYIRSVCRTTNKVINIVVSPQQCHEFFTIWYASNLLFSFM